ncbi:hypothetical protein EB001_07435 [bacterium]|nr:hypothetical protein [bacterium]
MPISFLDKQGKRTLPKDFTTTDFKSTLFQVLEEMSFSKQKEYVEGAYDHLIYEKDKFVIHIKHMNDNKIPDVLFPEKQNEFYLQVSPISENKYNMKLFEKRSDVVFQPVDKEDDLTTYQVFQNLFEYFRASFTDGEFCIEKH